MHDDVIIKNSNWSQFVSDYLKNDTISMVYHPPLLLENISISEYEGCKKINLPHLNSTMISSRKSLYTELGLRWYGYHIKNKFFLSKKEIEKIYNFYGVANDSSFQEGNYDYLSLDIGSFIYKKFIELKYEFQPMPNNYLVHLWSMSWREESYQDQMMKNNLEEIKQMELEIKDSI
jgi:hypothetical protein